MITLCDRGLFGHCSLGRRGIEGFQGVSSGGWLPHPEEVVFIYDHTLEQASIRQLVVDLMTEQFLKILSSDFARINEIWSEAASAHPVFLMDIMAAIKVHSDLPSCLAKKHSVHPRQNRLEERRRLRRRGIRPS